MSRVLVNGDAKTDGIDTLLIGSNRWTYKPGAVVTRDGRTPTAPVMMNIPTLVNFADKSFLENHCFHNGGLEIVGRHRDASRGFHCQRRGSRSPTSTARCTSTPRASRSVDPSFG